MQMCHLLWTDLCPSKKTHCRQNQAATDPQRPSLNEKRNVKVAETRQVFLLGVSYPTCQQDSSQDHLPGRNLRSQVCSPPPVLNTKSSLPILHSAPSLAKPETFPTPTPWNTTLNDRSQALRHSFEFTYMRPAKRTVLKIRTLVTLVSG